jgi:hypothetical protein
MSKKSKKIAAAQRLSEKRGQKVAMAAQYAAWKAAGANKKSKRFTLNAQRSGGVLNVKHASSNCGNHGCMKCDSHSPGNDPWLASKGSCIYGKRWSSPLWKQAA